jgi:single-strand DNA-binding protein
MTKHFNKIIFVGNLGGDPEMRYTPSGKAVVNFSVASSDQYVNSNGDKVNTTTWFKCTAWNKAAEVFHQYLHKGSKVLVEGKIIADEKGNPRIWEASDGSSHASFEINIAQLFFLDSANAGSSVSDDGVMDQAPKVVEPDEEELPF